MNLAEKLMSLRKTNGLTQMELAERLDVSRQAISRWEVGASIPSIDNLKVLSEIFEVPVDYLLHDEIENFSEKKKEPQAPVSDSQRRKALLKKRWVISIGVGVILVLLAVIISVVIAPNKKTEHITPIENMTAVDESEYTTFGFSIE